jgi:uncharacterized membrane protein YdjX (TVP38/TMEM64 family)
MNSKKLLILMIFATAAALFYTFDLHAYFTLESYRANRTALLEYYKAHPYGSIIAFISIYAVQTALFLPADIFLSLLSDALFGVAMGAVFANIGATLGATLGFLAARYVFSDFVQKRFGSKLESVNMAMEKDGIQYLVSMRLIPLFPFVLITLGAALTRMPLKKFSLGTMVGIIPGNILFCNAGASLAMINSRRDILSARTMISLGLLGVFSLLPLLYREIKRRRARNKYE